MPGLKRIITAAILFIFFSSPVLSQKDSISNASEKIFFNAKIFTADKERPYAEAVCIKDDKIVAVGNYEEVKKTVTANAMQIDLNGGFLMPGLIDSHEHAIDGGESLTRANTFDFLILGDSLAAFAEKVQADGTGMVDGFLVIDGINISTWSYLDELDQIFNKEKYKQMPVLLRGSDGHTAWANKVLLKKAGVTKDYIASSAAVRNYYGFNKDFVPNGFFADSAFDKINAVLPDFKTDWELAGVKAMEYNNSLGITALLDPAAGNIGNENNKILNAYQNLVQRNELTAHVAAAVVANADTDAMAQVHALHLLQQQYKGIKDLNIIGFKIFADGVAEYPTQTAAFSKPYINKPSTGVLNFDPDKFDQFVVTADKEGLLVHIHAIGDLAVTAALDGVEAARKANRNYNVPHTITHIQFALPKDFARFKQLNVLASLQLLWAYGDFTTVDILKPYIDPSIYKWQYPARSLLQAGTTICGASDWNVSSANPFEAIYTAETRLGSKGVLDSTQCMPRIDMLYAYTINAAKALLMEKNIGSIEPGKYADMILVDRDVLTITPDALKDTKVLWTMFEGKFVYKAK
ncbi:MAG TPA: amidohydrolase [Parafilimonas sp.]|nr:amidohydrolase [Parafilimonas sp.]